MHRLLLRPVRTTFYNTRPFPFCVPPGRCDEPLYFYDPDGHHIEITTYVESQGG